MLRHFISTSARAFRRDKRGAVAVLIAVAIIPLIGIMGMATDTARGYYVKSRLSSAVDAAALAGGQVYFQSRRDDDVRAFFKANFPPGFMGSAETVPEVTPSADNKTLTVRASATIPTTFMRLFGNTTMTVSASAEVTRESKALDVVLAIDMSSSMLDDISGHSPGRGESSKLELAKAAATQLIETLYGDQENVQYLRVGLVPWAGAVNVMTDTTKYGFTWNDSNGDGIPKDSEYTKLADADRVTKMDIGSYINNHIHIDTTKDNSGQNGQFDNQPDSYKSPNGQTTTTPTQNFIYYAHNSEVPLLSEPLFSPTKSTSPSKAASDNPSRVWDGCVWARWESSGPTADTENGLTTDWPGWSPRGIDTHLIGSSANVSVNVWVPAKTTGSGHHQTTTPAHWAQQSKSFSSCTAGGGTECTPCPANGITPLMHGKAEIEAAIDRLNIPDSGTYNTDIPQGLVWGWRVVSPEAPFTESADHPADYEPARAIILLTDGENTASVGDAYNGKLSDQGATGRNDSNVNSPMDNKLRDVAAAIKALKTEKGEPAYEIYVIQFANSGSPVESLLKEIATDNGSPYYFNAPTDTELQSAFKEIGNHLSNLRLSK